MSSTNVCDRDRLSGPRPAPTTKREPLEIMTVVIDVVADHYGLHARQILSTQRTANIVWARWVSIVLTHEYSLANREHVSALFQVDHTMVRYALRKVSDAKSNPKVAADLASIRERILKRAPEVAPTQSTAAQLLGAITQRVIAAEAEHELNQVIRLFGFELRRAFRRDPQAILEALAKAVRTANTTNIQENGQ